MKDNKWFDTVDTPTLCRGGGNGPFHPSQIRGLSLIESGESILDVGCGSATTLECIQEKFPLLKDNKYKGVDFIEKHASWCAINYPNYWFGVEDALLPNEEDNSWDVVWSRHVVDHLKSFEETLDNHIRVARKKVICILWYSLNDGDEHIIKNIEDQGKVYENEYLNQFSRKKVKKYLESKWPEWKPAIQEKIGLPNKKTDILIYLERK